MKYLAKLHGEEREFAIERHGGQLIARSGDKSYSLDVALVGDGDTFSLLVDGMSYDVVADVQREQVSLQMVGEAFSVHVEDERERAAHAVAGHKPSGRRELRAAVLAPARSATRNRAAAAASIASSLGTVAAFLSMRSRMPVS